jgi:hypothetical protein
LVLGAVYLLGFFGEPYLRKQIPLVTFALFAGLISASQLDRRRLDSEVEEMPAEVPTDLQRRDDV